MHLLRYRYAARAMSLIAALGLSYLGAAGCEKDQMKLPVTSGYEEFCAAYEVAWVGRQVDCFGADAEYFRNFVSCPGHAAQLSDRVSFYADRAEDCLGQISRAACHEFLTQCKFVLDGVQQRGEVCSLTAECERDLICDNRITATSSACSETCQPEVELAGLNEDCDRKFCGDGLICWSDDGVTSRCRPVPMPGDACLEGGFCGLTAWCDELSVCRELKSAGTECTDSSECGLYLSCPPSEPRTCRAGAKIGEQCISTLDCGRFSYCSTAGVCTRLSFLGERCAMAVDAETCAPDLYCDESSGTCKERRTIGEECDSTDQCETGLFCGMELPFCASTYRQCQ